MCSVANLKSVGYFVVVLLFYCWTSKANAQNLVYNPSFEDFVQCPKAYGTFEDDVLFWSKPTYGSSDYFNNCSSKMSLDNNFTGKQEAFHGDAYAGIYAYGPKDYREYIGGTLKTQLVKGKKYLVSARVSLSETSRYAVDEFGFLFTEKAVDLHTKRNIPSRLMSKAGISSFLSIRKRSYFDDKKQWVEVKGEYTAYGDERYITFGNFKENRKTRYQSTGSHLKNAAYYYVDLVQVEEIDDAYKLDEIYVFEGLNFEVNGFTLKGEAQKQLKPLIAYLKKNPNLNISIYGHTDNVGNKKYNKELSEKRAKTLGMFLVDHGLSPFRIAWHGYGDEKPILNNKTDVGRKKNRRVEFIISEKKREFYASGVFEDED